MAYLAHLLRHNIWADWGCDHCRRAHLRDLTHYDHIQPGMWTGYEWTRAEQATQLATAVLLLLGARQLRRRLRRA